MRKEIRITSFQGKAGGERVAQGVCPRTNHTDQCANALHPQYTSTHESFMELFAHFQGTHNFTKMFIPLIIVIALLGFVAWILSRPSVPIESPFKDIIMGILVLIAVLAVLDFLGFTHFGILTSIPIGR